MAYFAELIFFFLIFITWEKMNAAGWVLRLITISSPSKAQTSDMTYGEQIQALTKGVCT